MRTRINLTMTLLSIMVMGISSTTTSSVQSSSQHILKYRTISFMDNKMLELRGGVSKTKRKKGNNRTNSLSKSKTVTGKNKLQAEKDSPMEDMMKKYKSMLPLTRIYLTMVGLATLISVVLGEEMGQALLALDPIATINGFQLWRPFTAASFLGAPSISWLMSAYYLFEYGSSLERAYGTAQHIIFLLSQICILSVTSLLFAQPFFGPSIVTAMLHVLSRGMPKQKVKWLIFTVPYWSLPYGLMASDVLQSKSGSAALPHVLGILSGHLYYFHKFVWPKTGGEDWLAAPDFLVNRFDPDAKAAAKKVSSALKRKRSKGKKLGGRA